MSNVNDELADKAVEFLSQYYREDVLELANEYPGESSLWIDYSDLTAWDMDAADDLITSPEIVLASLSKAVEWMDVPVPFTLDDVTVRVTGLPDDQHQSPGSLRAEDVGRYVAIEGMLDRVTAPSDKAEVVAYQCLKCPSTVEVQQNPQADELQEPYECPGCERQGPFKIKHGAGEFSNYSKLRIEDQPSDDATSNGNLTAYVKDDLIEYGGDNGLLERAGEPIVVNGILKREQRSGRGSDGQLFDHLLEVNSVEFQRDHNTVDIAEHREEFQALADRGDAVDKFAESIAPNLHTTGAWDAAMEFAVAYLFGAPRIDVDNGPTYRGDLHFLIVSDYGMGKSDFASDIEAYSPKCISKSTTALSSGVGLTAAAVEDDFGEGAWTVKPGLLVRANGGHLILDEIDKGPDELTDMNDALEGKQQVDVEKAGKSITYNSRTGVMALGNPVEGRFDATQPISQQLGIADSLLSRFDGIVTMEDTADRDEDQAIAETYGRAYTEAQRADYEEDRDADLEVLDRPVSVDTGRAWVKYARENVHPVLSYEQFTELEEWYAEEVRQLNQKFAAEGEGEDMPVPATVRVLGAAVKMSIAFSRARLLDEVDGQAVERAKKLGKRLVKQNWNGESFDAAKDQGGPDNQKEARQGVYAVIDEHGPLNAGEIAKELSLDESEVEHHITKLSQQGSVVEPEYGVYRAL